MHRRYTEDTESMFAVFRYLAGNPIPIDTRVLASELRRWANTIGADPEFLHSIDPAELSQKPDLDSADAAFNQVNDNIEVSDDEKPVDTMPKRAEKRICPPESDSVNEREPKRVAEICNPLR